MKQFLLICSTIFTFQMGFAQLDFGESHSIGQNNSLLDYFLIDMNNDGDIDVISIYNDFSIDFTDHIKYYENNGDGISFTLIELQLEYMYDPWSITASDLNNDSLLDIIVGSYLGGDPNDPNNDGVGEIAWYENNGGGDFGNQEKYLNTNTGANQLICNDIDGDGDQDIIYENGYLGWLENNGNANFFDTITLNEFLESSLYDLVIGDFDNDDDIDLIDFYQSAIVLYKNDGNGNFTATPSHNGPFQESTDMYAAPIASDVDKDGDLDIVSVIEFPIMFDYHRDIVWFENNGNGIFSSPISITDTLGSFYNMSFQMADIDNDHDDDLIYTYNNNSLSNNNIFYKLNDGSGHFGAENIAHTLVGEGTASAFALKVADMDIDGDIDLVFGQGFGAEDDFVWLENVLINVANCDDFEPTVSSNISICQGDTIQIMASGGAFYDWIGNDILWGQGTNTIATNPTTTHTYQVVITQDNNGALCVDTLQTTITVFESIQASITPTDTTIEQGDTIQLNVQLFNPQNDLAMTYSWSPTEGLSDATIQNPQVYPTETTEYTLTISSLCSETTLISNIQVDVGVGILDNELSKSISIYPNPTSHFLNLQLNSSTEVTSIEILSSTVELMRTYEHSIQKISLEGLVSGLYFLKVETLEGTAIKVFGVQ